MGIGLRQGRGISFISAWEMFFSRPFTGRINLALSNGVEGEMQAKSPSRPMMISQSENCLPQPVVVYRRSVSRPSRPSAKKSTTTTPTSAATSSCPWSRSPPFSPTSRSSPAAAQQQQQREAGLGSTTAPRSSWQCSLPQFSIVEKFVKYTME